MISLPKNSVNLPSQLKEWIDKGFSLSQIAERLGTSKTWVIKTIQELEIKVPQSGRMTNPENYRHHTPPFGFKKKDGRLVPCRSQQRVCKLIVHLRKIEKLSFNAIAKKLSDDAHLNGKGSLYWDHKSVKKIYEKWKDKY